MVKLLMPVVATVLVGSSVFLNGAFGDRASTRLCSCECSITGNSTTQTALQVQENSSTKTEINTDTIVLTEGIVGGIIAPHVRLKIVFKPTGEGVDIWVKSQPDRTAKSKYVKGRLSVAEFKKLTASINEKKIWKLPVESPQGSQDIYQLDTSLNIRLGKQSWTNGGPQGCVHGQSKTQASDEQRKFFGEIVDQLKTSAMKHAKSEIDAANFEFAAKTIAGSNNN